MSAVEFFFSILVRFKGVKEVRLWFPFDVQEWYVSDSKIASSRGETLLDKGVMVTGWNWFEGHQNWLVSTLFSISFLLSRFEGKHVLTWFDFFFFSILYLIMSRLLYLKQSAKRSYELTWNNECLCLNIIDYMLVRDVKLV